MASKKYPPTKDVAFEVATRYRRLAARFSNPTAGHGARRAVRGRVIQVGINGRTFRMTPTQARRYAVHLMNSVSKLNPDQGVIVEYKPDGVLHWNRATVRACEVMPFVAEIVRAVKAAGVDFALEPLR